MNDMEYVISWREPGPLMNAKPDRMKMCPVCLRRRPIAEYLMDQPLLRTVVISVYSGEEFAVPVADVAQTCVRCRGVQSPEVSR